MAPYRTREAPRSAKAAPQTGLVSDMVRQFADVHAFVRELVQNGIDAGATAIEVVVDRSIDGTAAVRVTDDGCGMTVDVIENALLVLFRSTKDEDSTKIGKYGVGFMSVFAIEPLEVTVDTWRDGHAYRVRLFPDHSYEIESAAPREGHGTSVTLAKKLPAEEFEAFWGKVAASLHRWCRHAELPIHLTVVDGASAEPARRVRIDTPLEVRAIVSVRRKYDDMEIVLGPIACSGTLPETGTGEDQPAPFAGFYNRGLTLHETTEPLHTDLAGVRFKVLSPRLRHTLSRDDVRRDQAFHVAIARARVLGTSELKEKVLRELAAEAKAVARGADPDRMAGLLDVAVLAPVSAEAGELWVPLVHDVKGTGAMSADEAHIMYSSCLGSSRRIVLAATERSELTAALAARGVPVVWAVRPEVSRAIDRATNGALVVAPAHEECVLVRELASDERERGDDALCAALGEALARTGVERVALGHDPLGNVGVGVLVPDARPEEVEHVVATKLASLRAPRWPKGALLVLNASAEPVACARKAPSPAIAAQLLARFLLLSGPGLGARASEALTVRALERIS